MAGPNGCAPQLLPIEQLPPNHGRLAIAVWPVYLGLAEATSESILREPTEHLDYERGRIDWFDTANGLGRARVYLPKGQYTHFVFCTGPRENVIGVEQMAHPLLFDRSGYVDVDPIRNTGG